MNRRTFVLSSVAGGAGALLKPYVSAKGQNPGSSGTGVGGLFPGPELPERTWTQFAALGFTKPVCGVIYRKDKPPECGVPLGAIGTGCLDLDADGTLGYCSIFGSFVPARGQLRLPFLGLKVAKQTWVLASRYTDQIENVGKADEIHYWGHYPIADLEYETSAPVSVGLRSWSPFIPGDVAASNIPGAVFEVHLRNTTTSRQTGSLLFSFPGPTQGEAQVSPNSKREEVTYNWFKAQVPIAEGPIPAHRRPLDGALKGVTVSSEKGLEYSLGVLNGGEVRVGAPLGAIGNTWNTQAGKPLDNDFGTSLSVDFDLSANESTVVRFFLAWYAPIWKGEGEHCFTHMYATRYPNSQAVIRYLADNHASLLQRILNWQQAVYTYNELPVWMRDALINSLYLITEVSLWAAAKSPIGNWCRPADGLFAMNESPRECPQMECIPCSFYGNIPVVYFFPELALSTLRGYKAYQYPDGAAPWIFGGCTGIPATEGTEMAMPSRGYQTTTNGISYADMVDKYWLRTGDDEFLREFYPSVKQNMIYTMNLNPGPDGVISMPTGDMDPATDRDLFKQGKGHATEWVEGEIWYGMTSHVGGLHLAQLRIAERLAEKVGDTEFAEKCRSWFKQGSASMESKMWAGKYYLAFFEPATGNKSDHIFSCQLDGNWITSFHGLPGVFPEDRAKQTLATIAATNSPLARWGTTFFANPNGTPWTEAGYGPYTYFVSEQLMLAMTYMYAGEMEFGLTQARKCFENLVDKGYYWNQPCIIQAETGARISGYDYYQNMMLWSVPAALEKSDLRGPCKPGKFIDLIIHAAKSA